MIRVIICGAAGHMGQILTRVEAFLESLRATKGIERSHFKEKRLEDGNMYVLGIDSGSTSTNAVLLDDKKNIRAFAVVRTGAKSNDSADRILEEVLQKVGIAKEDLPYIFDRYYKVDKEHIRESAGTGIGLSIVKNILETHGAVYGVQSEVGKGSIFYFEL